MGEDKSSAEMVDKKTDMQKLTLIEDMMPHEIVLYYFPKADEEDIDFILWNKSPFPYGPIERINDDIYEWYLKSNSTLS
jgi:hypothetical protein